MKTISPTLNGIQLSGPVQYQEENDSYLFVNRLNEHDIYIEVKQDSRGGWFQSGGPNIHFPKEFVDSVGEEIDKLIKI